LIYGLRVILSPVSHSTPTGNGKQQTENSIIASS
jgi:hypothetical protein